MGLSKNFSDPRAAFYARHYRYSWSLLVTCAQNR